MTLSVASVCSIVNKQITNFSFQLLWKSHIFPFLGLFQEWMETHLFGRAPPDHKWIFFLHFYYFLDAFLKRNTWHQLYQSRKSSSEWRSETDWKIDVIVIELCVTKSWWIIKLNNRKIHQLFFSLSTSS